MNRIFNPFAGETVPAGLCRPEKQTQKIFFGEIIIERE
jgi:hypothetical protein